jgi:hypothetical protein
MTITREFSVEDVSEGLEGIEDSREVASRPWRWGSTRDFVFSDAEGNHWKGTLTFHRDDGVQESGTVTCTQVREVEKTIKVWEPVP